MPFTELEVQTWTLYTTVVIALVGFFFNIVFLHRTKRAEEDMARPYVKVFVDLFEIKDRQRVYVIKNFGKTPAYITDITVNGDLGIYNQHNFKSLIGNMIAPGQKFTSNIEDDFKGSSKITISYRDNNRKVYQDTFTLDTNIGLTMSYTLNESNKTDEIPSTIRQSTMALLRAFR